MSMTLRKRRLFAITLMAFFATLATVAASVESERKCLLQTLFTLGAAIKAPNAEVSPG